MKIKSRTENERKKEGKQDELNKQINKNKLQTT